MLRVNPERQACIFLCHNHSKIAHLSKKFSAWIHLSDSHLLIGPYHAEKTWQNQTRSLDIRFHILGPKLDQHCPIGPKKFWKFHLNTFYHTIVPYIAAKFGKNAYSISWGIGLDNFVPNRAKIAHLVHKRIFQEILFIWFLSTYSALLCCKV